MIPPTRPFLLALSAGGLAAGLLIGEGISRLCYLAGNSTVRLVADREADRTAGPRPSSTYRNRFGHRVRVNRHGLKGEELHGRRPGEIRILAAGDSIMAGEYLPEDERLHNILARRMARRTGKDVSIWSAAVGGYNTWQILRSIEEKTSETDPDILLIGVSPNDYVPFNLRAHKFGNRVVFTGRDGSTARYFDYLYQRSDLFKFAYDRVHQLQAKRRIDREGYIRYLKDYPYSVSPESALAWQTALEDMTKTARKNHARPFFIFFPLHPQICRNEEAMNTSLVSWAMKKKHPFIDLTRIFIAEDPSGMSLYENRDVIHPNSKAFRIAADRILDTLLDFGLVTPATL